MSFRVAVNHSLRILLAAVGIVSLLLVAAVRLTSPANYFPPVEPPVTSWDILGARVEPGRFEAPDGSLSAIKISALNDNGHIILPAVNIPRGDITFSVYLRADDLAAVNLYLSSEGSGADVTARLSPKWQRFSVTEGYRAGKPLALIGGGGSFVAGEAIYIWGTQLNTGDTATNYAAPEGSKLTWLGVGINRLGPKLIWLKAGLNYLRGRSIQHWVMAAALLCFTLLLLATPGARARSLAGVTATRRLFAANRFHARTTTVYCLIAIATLITLEIVSLAFNTLRYNNKQSLRAAFSSVVEQAPIARAFQIMGLKQQSRFIGESTAFSPLTQVARLPGEGLPPYLINRLGLIDNENPNAALRVMPEKTPGMIRIVLYGGSTAMGIGAPDGTRTITAQLERLLNEKAKPGSMFQVLNFGVGGGQTYSDLEFMAAMGSKLDVDVSITLNGFNDAFFATESSKFYDYYDYLINWSDFSYHFYDTLNGLAPPSPIVVPLLPFTSLLFNDLVAVRYQEDSARRKRFFAEMPMRVLTQHFDASHRRDELLRENLRFMAGYFIHRDRLFLSYLQPHPLQYRRLLESGEPETSEAELVKQSIQRLALESPREYERRIVAMFDAYAGQYKQLAHEYGAYPNIRFIDIRAALDTLPTAAYIDIIHYSPDAQRRLAERMFEDLSRFEIIRSQLRR